MVARINDFWMSGRERENMSRKPWYRSKYFWLTLVVALAAGGFGAYRFFTVKADKPNYILGTVERGDIVVQVGATGTLAAVTTVQVGTQVSGTIAELHADFNSEVKQGQLLAKLDPAMLGAQVEQQEANVRTAEATLNDTAANIASTKANLEKAKVDVLDKQRKLKRIQELFNSELVPRDDLDTAQAAVEAAVATQKASEAQLASTEARYKADESRLNQSRASLRLAKVNLDHSIIHSPISGTIISRTVDVGQTVAASFSSPTLFTIAADLTKMQVNTNIDEADVGRIKPGMGASFTVDAYPGENFTGTISQVRLASVTVQNVVTYNAIIDVPNPQLKLKPGMTTNVKILIESADDVLKIPNSALRFRPDLSEAAMAEAFKRSGEEKYWEFAKSRGLNPGGGSPGPQAGSSPPGGGSGRGFGGRGGGGSRGELSGMMNRSAGVMNRSRRGQRVAIWVQDPDKLLRPVVLRLGLSDGVNTQIDEGKLKEGDKIIIGTEFDPNRATTTTTPPPGFGGPSFRGGGGFRR
jgi:HlyD family secretion protein